VSPTLRILLRKEWRQLVASKQALAVGFLLPALMLGALPYLVSSIPRSDAPPDPSRALPPSMSFGMFAEIEDDPRRLALVVMSQMIVIVGLVLPTMFATHLLITERERRTLELLIALPVRIQDVLLAKMIAVLGATALGALPLLAVDMVLLPMRGVATVGEVLALPFLLVCVLAYATATALLLALLAKDFRTANNLGGALLAPSIIVTSVLILVLPGGAARPLLLGLLFLAAAGVVARVALRASTFEKLLR
jgi:ABC-type Na+ efflux pump permease subunit